MKRQTTLQVVCYRMHNILFISDIFSYLNFPQVVTGWAMVVMEDMAVLEVMVVLEDMEVSVEVMADSVAVMVVSGDTVEDMAASGDMEDLEK